MKQPLRGIHYYSHGLHIDIGMHALIVGIWVTLIFKLALRLSTTGAHGVHVPTLI